MTILLLIGCKQNKYDEVWHNYEWLPPGAENSNPYVLTPQHQRGYGNYPYYDNDAEYVQPRGWGMCNGTNNLGNCE